MIRFNRYESWNGIEKRDPIKLAGERGEFRFVHYAEMENGEHYCLIYGGTPGHQKMRCVDPDRVTKIEPKKTRRKSAQ